MGLHHSADFFSLLARVWHWLESCALTLLQEGNLVCFSWLVPTGKALSVEDEHLSLCELLAREGLVVLGEGADGQPHVQPTVALQPCGDLDRLAIASALATRS